jgi:hypothetical protein
LIRVIRGFQFIENARIAFASPAFPAPLDGLIFVDRRQ